MTTSASQENHSIVTSIVNEIEAVNSLQKHIDRLPNQNTEILHGVYWGNYSTLYTPAYWKIQYLFYTQTKNSHALYKLGESIMEEVVACLLGGFGLKAELGMAAFRRLKQLKLIAPNADHNKIRTALKTPFEMNGKLSNYRFPNQKAKYIYQFLNRKDLYQIKKLNDLQLRSWLLTVNGIGYKTASWVTRNCMDSQNVAILDIHIIRAGIIMGLYSEPINLKSNYLEIEELFLKFCKTIKVKPAIMDALIWEQMKNSNLNALSLLKS